MSNLLPKRLKSDVTAEIGVNSVSSIVNDAMGWIFRRTHQEHDYGIDGYIDQVTTEGQVTGKYIAVQIKCGSSYLQNADGRLQFRGNEKHLNYLLNQPTPVILTICDPRSRDCYWTLLRQDMIDVNSKGWTHPVSINKKLSFESVADFNKIVGEISDNLTQLEDNKATLALIREFSDVVYCVSKKDVEKSSNKKFREFVERVAATDQLAREVQGKLRLVFSGYERNPNELFEIPEVKRWVKRARIELDIWFLFARRGGEYGTLGLIAACTCDAKKGRKISEDELGARISIDFDGELVLDFIRECWDGLNRASDRWDWSDEYNKRISGYVIDELMPPEFSCALRDAVQDGV